MCFLVEEGTRIYVLVRPSELQTHAKEGDIVDDGYLAVADDEEDICWTIQVTGEPTIEAGGASEGEDTEDTSSSSSSSGTSCARSKHDDVQDLRFKVASRPLGIEHYG